MSIFERYLSLWVGLSIAIGITLGVVYPPLLRSNSNLRGGPCQRNCCYFYMGNDLPYDGSNRLFYNPKK